MTRERFQELAQAYGGDIARWPAEARDAAGLLAAAEPEFAREVLGREAALDAALFALPLQTASSELFERIVVAAPPLRTRRLRWRWLTPAGLGASLAAAAAAGVILGVQLSEHASSASAAVTDATTARAIAEVDVTGLSGDV